MDIYLSLIAHVAAAYLHGILIWRLFPQRKTDKFIYFFWQLMLLCVMLHIVYASYFLSHAFQWTQLSAPIVGAGYILVAFVPPFLVTLFLGELTYAPPPARPITKFLASINNNTYKLFWGSMAISVLTLVPAIYTEVIEEFKRYTFGNVWTLAYMVIFVFVWMGMRLAGLESKYLSKEHKNSKSGYVLTVSLLIIFSLLSVVLDFGHLWSLIPIITTVGLAFSFCWSRFRVEFIDVALKQLFNTLFLMLSTVLLYALSHWSVFIGLSAPIQLIILTITLICGVALFTLSTHYLYLIWRPKSAQLQNIHTLLPVKLSRCTDRMDAIQITESVLSEIFQAKINIVLDSSQEKPSLLFSHSLSIVGEPCLKIQMGLQKGWIPWFSESLDWVNFAGLYLQNHLQVLDVIELENRKKIENQQLIALKAKAELAAMRSQIRPHFLFNTLNSIHSFVTIAPQQAEITLEHLSDLLRGTLLNAERDEIPLMEEIQLVRHYLEIEKVRYGEQLSYSENLNIEMCDFRVPSFSIQPLVENAVKHGVDAQFEPVHISLCCKVLNKQLIIEVTDNGPGLTCSKNPAKKGIGMALQNIQERLIHLYGTAAKLELVNGELGAISRLTIPLSARVNKPLS